MSDAPDRAEIAETAARLRQDTVQLASQTAAHVSAKVQDHAADFKEHAGELKDQAADKLKQVGAETEKMADAARAQVTAHVSTLQDILEQEIRERPLRALGVAAGIGVVIGLLTAR